MCTHTRGEAKKAVAACASLSLVAQWAGLKWWEAHAAKFPNLSVMARQYLSCPATSASVERLFSKVGINFSAKRKSAEAETLSDIVFTKENLA